MVGTLSNCAALPDLYRHGFLGNNHMKISLIYFVTKETDWATTKTKTAYCHTLNKEAYPPSAWEPKVLLQLSKASHPSSFFAATVTISYAQSITRNRKIKCSPVRPPKCSLSDNMTRLSFRFISLLIESTCERAFVSQMTEAYHNDMNP